ncbi:hypothetical protein L484_013247 [Morus notabilis]|uniref:Uncharacterized protein n=1 Tax=Morus notabilis TaxID=981085 RepID=W9S3Q1_9ROSA|nr:hypothetical protein L484_013247 [Morus notabilis]
MQKKEKLKNSSPNLSDKSSRSKRPQKETCNSTKLLKALSGLSENPTPSEDQKILNQNCRLKFQRTRNPKLKFLKVLILKLKFLKVQIRSHCHRLS